MNGTHRPQEKFVHSRIQPSEEHTPLKYVATGEGMFKFSFKEIEY